MYTGRAGNSFAPARQHLVIHRLGQCSQCRSRILDVGIHLVLTYLAVPQHDVAAAVLCNLGIVGDKYDGAPLSVKLLKETKNFKRGACVQISGCLVGQY